MSQVITDPVCVKCKKGFDDIPVVEDAEGRPALCSRCTCCRRCLSHTIMPFGQFKGWTFDEITQEEDGLSYLDWLIGRDGEPGWALYGEFRKRLYGYIKHPLIQQELDHIFYDRDWDDSRRPLFIPGEPGNVNCKVDCPRRHTWHGQDLVGDRLEGYWRRKKADHDPLTVPWITVALDLHTDNPMRELKKHGEELEAITKAIADDTKPSLTWTQKWDKAADYLIRFETTEDPNDLLDLDRDDLRQLVKDLPAVAPKLREAYRAYRERLRNSRATPTGSPYRWNFFVNTTKEGRISKRGKQRTYVGEIVNA